jgi:hypothetical protein
VANVVSKSFAKPDDVVEFPNVRSRIVELGDLTVGELVSEPGWRWSEHVRPTVGGEWCQARHVGYIVSGSLGIDFMDGTRAVFGPGDVFDIPPVTTATPSATSRACRSSGWASVPGRAFRPASTAVFSPPCSSPMSSTPRAAPRSSATHAGARSSRRSSRRAGTSSSASAGERSTPPATACSRRSTDRLGHCNCAAALLRIADRQGVQIRVGVHVGEVELVGADVRGIAVHEAARVMAAAAPGEILVSEMTRALVGASGLRFEDRGVHELKGIEGEWRLAAYSPGS